MSKHHSTILLFDDDLFFLEELELRLSALGAYDFLRVTSVEAAGRVIKEVPLRLALLDMQVPGNDRAGIDVARLLGSQQPGCPYIFLTGFAAYRHEIYPLSPAAFLEKPISNNLEYAVELVLNTAPAPTVSSSTPSHPDVIFLADRRSHVRLVLSTVLYAYADKKCVIIHTTGGDYLTHASLNSLATQLVGLPLVRVNRGTLVNLNHVERYDHATVWVGKHAVAATRRGIEQLAERLVHLRNK